MAWWWRLQWQWQYFNRKLSEAQPPDVSFQIRLCKSLLSALLRAQQSRQHVAKLWRLHSAVLFYEDAGLGKSDEG